MSIDVRLEIWTRWLVSQIVQWSLIGWNRVTEVWDASMEYGAKIRQSIENAHKRDIWMFINANQLPYCVKDGYEVPVPSTSLFYYPDTHTFTLNTRLQENQPQRFDVVSVQLRTENSRLLDLSSFFHSINWKPRSEPSLWEVVEVYWMQQRRPASHILKSNWSLVILDSNAEEHVISLNSSLARQRFGGWV